MSDNQIVDLRLNDSKGNPTGEVVYPRTVVQAVSDGGKPLREYLDEIGNNTLRIASLAKESESNTSQLADMASSSDLNRRIMTKKVALICTPFVIPANTETLVLSYANTAYGEIKKVFICISSGEYSGASSYNTVRNVASRYNTAISMTIDSEIELINPGVGSIKSGVEIKFELDGANTNTLVKNNRSSLVYATVSFIGINNMEID